MDSTFYEQSKGETRHVLLRVYFDVDGVMTDGKFVYTESGKISKTFGPEDAEALKLLRAIVPITFLSADWRGFEITRARIETDMEFRLEKVSTVERLEWIKRDTKQDPWVYMGDSFVDSSILTAAHLSIAPANAHPIAIRCANYVTNARGGEGAVAEACSIIVKEYDLDVPELRWE